MTRAAESSDPSSGPSPQPAPAAGSAADAPTARTEEPTAARVPAAPTVASSGGRCAETATGAGPRPSAEQKGEDGARREGSTFGRYTLYSALGAGGMGVVWKAFDRELGRVVALKVIRANADAVQLARFEREARLCARLHHPHIVAVHDAGAVDGEPYIVMDCIEGRTLRALMAETRALKCAGGTPDLPRLRAEIEVLATAAEAVEYAHAQGILHRDLKPDNVLLDGAGHPYVVDFGIARLLAAEGDAGATEVRQLTATGHLVGTVAYMSPEQVQADPDQVGPRSDVWALGAMLYELLTGHQPFTHDTPFATVAALLGLDPEPPRRTHPRVPEELEAVCLAALEKEEERRTASAGEFAADLRRWLGGEAVSVRAHGWPVQLRRFLHRHRRGLAVAAVALAAIALALGTALWLRAGRMARFRAALDAIAGAVREFEDQLHRVGPPAEARTDLARQSLGLIEAVIREQPECGSAYAWRARVCDALGEAPAAEEDAERAVRLAPENPVPCWARGLRAIEAYVASRGLPETSAAKLEHRFLPRVPETESERRLRLAGQADLERLESLLRSAPAAGELPQEEARLAGALLALYAGGDDGCARAVRELAGVAGPRAARLRGIALYYRRAFGEAAAAFDAVLAEWPHHAQTWLHRGLAHEGVAQGQHPIARWPPHWVKAIDDLTEALRLDPECVAAYAARGRIRHTLGDHLLETGQDPSALWLEAAQDFDAALARKRGDPALLVGRAAVAGALAANVTGRTADVDRWERAAWADLAEAVAAAPDLARAYRVRHGLHLHAAQRAAHAGGDAESHWTAAFADLDEVVRLEPDQSAGYDARGTAYRTRARDLRERRQDARTAYRQAIADFDAALALAPGQMWMLQNRGGTWAELAGMQRAMGEDATASLHRAEEDFRNGVAQGDSWCWGNLAQLLTEQGRFAEAVVAVRRYGAEVAQEGPRAHDQLREILERLAQDEEAQGRDGEAALRALLGALDAELAAATPTAAALCDRAAVHAARGAIQRRKQQDGCAAALRALGDFSQAVALEPGSPFLRTCRGRAWSDLAQAQAAVRIDPAGSFRQAEEDLRFAAGEGWVAASLALAQLLNGLRRHEDARQEMAALLAQAPGLREAVRPHLLGALRGLWRQALERAGERMRAGDYAGARPEFAAAFAHWEEECATMPEAARARALADIRLRGILANARYNAACVEAVAGLGKTGPPATAVALDPAAARAHREGALAHLAEAVRLGFTDFAHMGADPDLAALHDDPRFAALAARGK